MSVVSCPKCADSVVMPGGISPQATVRCPLCQEEFLLAEVLDSLPPALVVVHDPQAAGQGAGTEPFSFVESEGEGSPYELAEPEGDSQTPSFAIESRATTAAPTTAGTGKRRRAAPRPQRKTKSPAMEVVKVVLGGIAGLTIAQLILWWMPWTAWRRDPFKLGPKVATYASWVVPAQFHGKITQPSQDGDNAETPPPDFPPPSAKSPVADGAGSGLPQRTFVNPNMSEAGPSGPGQAKTGRSKRETSKQPEEPNNAGDDSAGPTVVEPAEDDRALSPPDDAADDSGVAVGPLPDLILDTELLDMIGSPSSEPGSVNPGSDATQDVEAPDESAAAQIMGAPQVTAAELRAVLEETKNTTRAWLLAEDPSSRELVSQSYRALAKLGEAITFSASASEEDRSSISEMLASLAADDGRLSNIRLLGSHWPAYPQRDTAGVLLAGTVAETRMEGELHVTDVVVADDQEPISVYGATDPADRYEKGASIMLLGAIVENPAGKVAGYQGDADWLIWYGLSHTISDD